MNLIDQITTYIVRPNRQKYHINRLGPKHLLYNTSNYMAVPATRQDYSLANKNNQKIVYSFFSNHVTQYPSICVVYLHANNGSRVEGLHYLEALLCNKLNVCILDFSGSGLSQGQFITLGPNQTEDLVCLFNDLRQKKGITKMILWGRSMGACTALMYAHKYPQNVIAMILDSPFKDLRKLVKQTASQRTGLPKFFFEPVLNFVDDELYKKIGHRFEQYKMKKYITLNESENAGNKNLGGVPTLFLASQMDTLVKAHHVQKLYNRYPGIPGSTKFLHYISNQHHQNRDSTVIEKCITFIINTLSTRQNFCLRSYQQTNPFSTPIQNSINAESQKFSFKTQAVLRPQSSFLAQNNQANFCLNMNTTTIGDSQSNLQYMNKSIKDYKSRIQTDMFDSPLKNGQSYTKRIHEKINLSKNQNKTILNNSFQSSDQHSNMNMSMNGMAKTSRMINSFQNQQSPKTRIKLNQNRRTSHELSDLNLLSKKQSKQQLSSDLRATIKGGNDGRQYFSSPITIMSMRNINGDQYKFEDDVQNANVSMGQQPKVGRSIRDYNKIKDRKIDLRIHSRKHENKQQQDTRIKYANPYTLHTSMQNNENANNVNLIQANTNTNDNKYKDIPMIQSVSNAPKPSMTHHMHPQGAQSPTYFGNSPQYGGTSNWHAQMRSPSPIVYNPIQTPAYHQPHMQMSMPQPHPQYYVPHNISNRVPVHNYNSMPSQGTKQQLSKNRSYANISDGRNGHNGHNYVIQNSNSKISLSKLGAMSRTNGLYN